MDVLHRVVDEEVACSMCDSCVVENDGYNVCKSCGVVVSFRVIDNAEWTNYAGVNNSRCGASINTTDLNPYTTETYSFIPKGIKNVFYQDGKTFKYDISKIHIQNNFNHKQKSFSIVENTLDNTIANKYSKNVLITAKILWGEITKEERVVRAGVRKGLIACCIYYACIHHNHIKTPLEISGDFGIDGTKSFNKGDKIFKEIFEKNAKWSHLITRTSNPNFYFPIFCSELESNYVIAPRSSFQLARDCAALYNTLHDVDMFPKGLACGIIYVCLWRNNIHVPKSTLCNLLGVCEPSLTKCVNRILA
jgi:transcription initiation factor TFIIIB Brf1 subunit/transcription initiation factor TFIIB